MPNARWGGGWGRRRRLIGERHEAHPVRVGGTTGPLLKSHQAVVVKLLRPQSHLLVAHRHTGLSTQVGDQNRMSECRRVLPQICPMADGILDDRGGVDGAAGTDAVGEEGAVCCNL